MKLAVATALLFFGALPTASGREPESYPTFPTRVSTPQTARTAARLAHALRDPLTAERLDVPPDVLAAARDACLQGAATAALPPAARADALACAADLGADVLGFLDDPVASVRASAAGIAGVRPDARTRAALAKLAADPDDAVAAVALGALCADDATRTLLELGPQAKARVAALAADKNIDPGQAARLARCAPQATAPPLKPKPKPPNTRR